MIFNLLKKMDYENENSIKTTDINLNNINNNCKINNEEIKCQICPSSNKLESEPKEYIHQLPSNQSYLEKKNDINEKINSYKNYQEISSTRFNKNNNSNLESTFSQTFRTFKYEPLSYCPSQDSLLNNLNETTRNKKALNLLDNYKNNNKSLTYYNYNKGNKDYDEIFLAEKEAKKEENVHKNPSIYNYIEQMRKIYEAEQNNIRLKQYQLQKELFRTNEENERKINNLNIEIDNTKSKNENDIKNLMKENEYEKKKELDKREKEIIMLSNRNFELELANNDLIEKINKVTNVINKDKKNIKEKISCYQMEIENISKNNDDLKNYYEKKIAYLIRIFNEEKNKLIGAYEFDIDKTKLGFIKSKNDYINQAQQKDNKLRNIINNNNNEANKLNNEIAKLKEEILKLKADEKLLIQKNIEIKKDNEIIKQNYEAAKKDLQYQVKQKQKIEQNLANIQRQFYKIKVENENLNRLTYGNFKRSKSKGF